MDTTQLNEALSIIYDEEQARIAFWNNPQQEFDEKLRHYADHRSELDLDEGVKVNYGRFGTCWPKSNKLSARISYWR